MNYFGATINDTSTVAEKAGAKLSSAEHLAMAYDAEGNVIVNATEGGVVAGILLPECANAEKGNDVTIQIKNIGYAKAGAAVTKGDFVMADTAGKAIKATAGKYYFGKAMSAAAADGDIISVDMDKCGYAGS